MVELKLPGGLRLPVSPGEKPEAVYWRHAATSLSEGLCPNHQTSLEPVAVKPGSGVTVGAHCGACHAYWSLSSDPEQTVGTDMDWRPDPWRGAVMLTPDWVA